MSDEFYVVIFFQEVLRLIVSSFENLHDMSNRWHETRISILEIVAKVRLSVVMLDLECDALVLVQMMYVLLAIIW